MRRRVPDTTVSHTLVAVGGEACPTGGRQKQSSKRQGSAGQGRASLACPRRVKNEDAKK